MKTALIRSLTAFVGTYGVAVRGFGIAAAGSLAGGRPGMAYPKHPR